MKVVPVVTKVTKQVPVVEDQLTGYTITLSLQEAAVLSALAGGANPGETAKRAVYTGRADKEYGPVSDLMDSLARIVPLNNHLKVIRNV